jgi:hypothetical protein
VHRRASAAPVHRIPVLNCSLNGNLHGVEVALVLGRASVHNSSAS